MKKLTAYDVFCTIFENKMSRSEINVKRICEQNNWPYPKTINALVDRNFCKIIEMPTLAGKHYERLPVYENIWKAYYNHSSLEEEE